MADKEQVNLTQAKVDAEAAATEVEKSPEAAKEQAKADAGVAKTDAKVAVQAHPGATAKAQADAANPIGDMFEVQMAENHLQQLDEMATSVESASNSAISDMARNLKS